MTLKSSSACYCSKRLRKRVPNSRSGDTERSLPELSPGSGYNEVGSVGRTYSLLCDKSRLTGSVTSLMYAGDLLLCAMCINSANLNLCPWTTKSLKIFKDFTFCKLSVMYDHVTSINSVTATVHEDTTKNILLTDIRYYMPASKPFFTATQCCCPRRKSLSLSPRTNLQVLVLVFEL